MDFSAYVYCLLMAIAPWVPFKCNLCFLPFKVDHLCSNQAWHLYWVPLEWAWHVQLPAQQPFWHQVHLLINLGCRFLEWRDNIDFWRFIHPHQLWMLLEIESLGSQTLAAVYTTLQLWLCTMALVQAQVEFNTQLLKLNFKSYQVPSPFLVLFGAHLKSLLQVTTLPLPPTTKPGSTSTTAVWKRPTSRLSTPARLTYSSMSRGTSSENSEALHAVIVLRHF